MNSENWQDTALISAGVLGALVAVIHGYVMQRLLVRPLEELVGKDQSLRSSSKRLLSPLLHVSTLNWFVCGASLIWAGMRFEGEARAVISASAAIIYGYAAVLNARATRGRHPGWILMAISVALIFAGSMRWNS